LALGGCASAPAPSPAPILSTVEVTGGNAPANTLAPLVNASCSEVIEKAIASVGEACAEVGRNQACYGHRLINAETTGAIFNDVGNIAALSDLRRLSITALNPAVGTWGVALVKAQANLPNTSPGQNVLLLLFGEASATGLSDDLSAVVLSTGIGRPTCSEAPPNALLIQSPTGQQITLNMNGATVTMGSTLYFTAQAGGQMTIATLEGTGVVSANGGTRTVLPGTQVRLDLGGQDGLRVISAPSAPEAYDLPNIRLAPLTLLERSVVLPPVPAALATNVDSGILSTATLPSVTGPQQPATATPTCQPRADWTATYTVQRGDTLSRIARNAGISLADLQSGNCIDDANRISVGQVLRVPRALATAAPTTAPRPVASNTPTPASFSADDSSVMAGQCTTVRWQVSGASSVFFENQQVSAPGSQQVCLRQTSTYTLLVVYPDGTQLPYTLTVVVPICGDRVCDNGENANTCTADCASSAAAICGNGVCEASENTQTCSTDCGPG
jgi:LysM repeat protein